MISLDIYGTPVPQARPRVVKQGNFVRTYNPQQTLKEQFQWQIKSQFRNEPITVPVSVDVIFFFPVPKGTSGIRTRQMLNGAIHHDKRPDVDNLQKFILDCLNKIVLADDAQVVEIRARKVYAQQPGTLIKIRDLTQQNFGTNEDRERTV